MNISLTRELVNFLYNQMRFCIIWNGAESEDGKKAQEIIDRIFKGFENEARKQELEKLKREWQAAGLSKKEINKYLKEVKKSKKGGERK